MKDNVHFLSYRSVILIMRYVSDIVVEKIKTHIVCTVTFLFPQKSYRLGKNVKKKFGKARQATNDNIIRRMRFACWIAKATKTHPEYVITAFLRQQWLREALPTRGEGGRFKLPGLGTPEGGPGPSYVQYVCVFCGNIVICRSYKLPPFRPHPSHSANQS
jgi:hypothetical protein